MKIKFVTGFFVVVCIVGCAPKGEARYKMISGDKSPLSINDAAKTNPGTSIDADKELEFEINEEDKVLVENNIYASYKLFSFNNIHKGKFQIEIGSLCDCLGINKYILIPKLFIIDSTVTIHALQPFQISYLESTWTLPARLRFWYETNLEAGEFKILICADNSDVDQPVAQILPKGLIPLSGPGAVIMRKDVNFTSYPFGKMILKIME